MYHIFFIHSSIDGHLGCFHILAIKNNAAINIGVPIFFQICVFIFIDLIPRSGIARSDGSSILNFLRISILFSSYLYSPQQCLGFSILYILSNICLFLLFWYKDASLFKIHVHILCFVRGKNTSHSTCLELPSTLSKKQCDCHTKCMFPLETAL